MKYTYLLVNFFTIIIPFIFSFHPKLLFYKVWPAFFKSTTIVAIWFLCWDVYFTHLGIWGFNPRYLCGLYIFNLPIEEVLFFFCIPYACVFTFHCIDGFMKKPTSQEFEKYFNLFLMGFLSVLCILFFDRAYSLFSFLTGVILLALSRYVLRIKWLGKFFVIYGILMFPFLIVNGVLTGTGLEEPVVWYNDLENMGLRILTIPFEDIFYGMSMILLNLIIFHRIKNEPQ